MSKQKCPECVIGVLTKLSPEETGNSNQTQPQYICENCGCICVASKIKKVYSTINIKGFNLHQ
jgi:hypothetical protein